MPSLYYCHHCNQTVTSQDGDLKCGQCQSEFIEQLPPQFQRAQPFAPHDPLFGHPGVIGAHIPDQRMFTGTNPINIDLPPPFPPNTAPPPHSPFGVNFPFIPSDTRAVNFIPQQNPPPVMNTRRYRFTTPFPPSTPHPVPNVEESGPGPNQQANQQEAPPGIQRILPNILGILTGNRNVPPQPQPGRGANTGPREPNAHRVSVTMEGGEPRELLEAITGAIMQGHPHGVQIQLNFAQSEGARGATINIGDYVVGDMENVLNNLMAQFGDGHPVRGLTEDQLRHIPMAKVTQKHVDNKTQCSTCFEDFTLDEDVGQLPCSHIFHVDCVKPWLLTHNTCPMCRMEIDPNLWSNSDSSTIPPPPSAPSGMIDSDELD